jgi:hypothetical protein
MGASSPSPHPSSRGAPRPAGLAGPHRALVAVRPGRPPAVAAAVGLGVAAALVGLPVSAASVHAQTPEARLSLSVSNDRVEVGDTLELELRAEVEGAPVQSLEPPSVEPFQVLRRSQRQPRQFSFSFGGRVQQFQSTVVDTLLLRATRAGSFVLGPATLKSGGRTFRSNRVNVYVEPGPGGLTALPGADDPDASQGGRDHRSDPRLDDPGESYDPRAFLRTMVSPTRARVGEQVTVTVLLYVADRLRGNPSILREATADGFWVQDLTDRRTLVEGERVTVGGRRFHVYVLRRFAAFPLRPGTATIGEARVRLPLGSRRLRLGRSEPIERSSRPIEVEVAPLPTAGRPDRLQGVDDGDIAVGRYTMKGTLDRRRIDTGEALTVTYVVEGQGNLKTVHLDLEVDPGSGLEVLPPEVDDEVRTVDDLVMGRRTHRWLVVPTRPGAHTLPKVNLPVWEPERGRWRLLEGPTLSFVATGAARAEDDDDDPAGEGAARDGDRDAEGEASGDGEDAPAFGPLRQESALLRRRAPVSGRPWYPAAAAAPPVVFLGFLLARGLRRRRARRLADQDPRQLARAARKRAQRAARAAGSSDPAGLAGELARILEGTLGQILDEPVGGYTRRELADRLERRRLPEGLRRRLVDELERLDLIRFGMPDPADDRGEARGPGRRAGGGPGEAARRVSRILDELGRAASEGLAPAAAGTSKGGR